MKDSAHAFEPLTLLPPQDLLWDYAYAISERRSEQQAWLDSRYEELKSQDRSRLGMLDKVKFDDRVQEYTDGYVALQGTINDEAAALQLLELVEAGEAGEDAIIAFIPEEFIKARQQSREEDKKRPRTEQGFRLSRGYVDIFSFFASPTYDMEAGLQERLTTGRNRSSLNAGNLRLDGRQAVDAFFSATADTHGGKVRQNGKKGRTYASKSGKVIRKS